MSTRGTGVLAVAAVGALAVGPVVDPDLGFHLATARAVLDAGAVPATNVLSFAASDAPAVHHQWLPAVVFELAWRLGGAAGVVAVRVALVVLAFAVVHRTARVLGARPAAAAAATVCAGAAAAFRFLDRPLLFSNATNAMVVLGLAIAATGRRRGGLALVAGALAVGAQLHAGVVFGAFAVLAWALAEAVPSGAWAWVRLPIGPASGDEPRPLATLGAGGLGLGLGLATLATYHPRPWAVLAVPFAMGRDSYLHAHLVVYRVPWEQPIALLLPYWVFVGSIGVASGAWLGRGARSTSRATDVVEVDVPSRVLPAGPLAVAVLGLAASLTYARFVDLAALFAGPLLALLGSHGASSRWARSGPALAASLALVARLAVVPPGPPTLSQVTWPIALDAFRLRERLGGRAFVQDGWAGPFLGLHFPAETVFFHPSFESYPEGFYRDVYQRTRDGGAGWEAVLAQYDVELVWMKHTSPGERRRQRGQPNLRQRLVASPHWALVAFDDLGSIVVRRRGTNASAAARLSIDGVDPDRGVFLGAPAASARALEAFRRRGLPSARLDALLHAASR